MAHERKPLSFKIADGGRPVVLEVKKDGKTILARVAVMVTEIFDTHQLNPFDGEPILEIRVAVTSATQSKAVPKRKAKR